MYNATQTPATRGALHCPSWCDPAHRTDPDLTGDDHTATVYEADLWDLHNPLSGAVLRPYAGSYELLLEQPRAGGPVAVTLAHTARGAGQRRVPMTPAEARSLAAALLRAADLAEGGAR